MAGLARSLALASCLGACDVARSEPAASPTLRDLYHLAAPRELTAASTALVLVDFQDEFFHGKLPVAHGEAAVARAAALRQWARAHGVLVVHVRNVVTRPDTPIFGEHSPTIAIVPALTPAADELVITKHQAGGFSKTELDQTLRARGVDTVIVAGIMTHLAVDTTARDGAVLGYRMIVAGDACATRTLRATDGGPPIDAAVLQRVALASIADRFADVLDVDAIRALPVR
ncbi:MAG: cysteine hydrolase [Deltaproteobacteria bacterium]|nr:cysteine hydrolase [Deltaproteobacteria bacterium]